MSHGVERIVGIGTDLVDVRRIHRMLLTYPRFVQRVFTPWEQAQKKAPLSSYYGKRFAAKEAFSKATGLGIGANFSWTDIEVRNNPKGSPFLVLSSSAAQRVRNWLGGSFQPFLSLADEYPYALAYVILSASFREDAREELYGPRVPWSSEYPTS